MSNQEEILETLAYWKRETFQDDRSWEHLNLDGWELFKTGTKKLVVFSYVFVWQWLNSLETGNYIPIGEHLPTGVNLEKMTRHPGTRSTITYVFDMKINGSFQENMQVLEGNISSSPEFKALRLTRKTWQNHAQRHGAPEDPLPPSPLDC
ncbi:hypothetical protein CPB83DRAFT_900108 [Crepidotus variabilis]|uniref:Uncharacterized protein n=1 Tax=Crepidotus variabilis TaxID=179855 RepID=A0A9P6JI24_9AGAR|nr:hypothetical protein CPB83DRAFT_900108 [Crepidotus variabilis]